MSTDSCPRCGAKLAASITTDWACPRCGFDPTSAHEQAGTNSHQGDDASAIQQVREVEGKTEKDRLPSPGPFLSKIAVYAAVLGLGVGVLSFLLAVVSASASGEWQSFLQISFVGVLVFLLGLAGIIASRLALVLWRRGLPGSKRTLVLILLWPAVLSILLFAASWLPLPPLNGPHLQIKYLAGQRKFERVDLYNQNLNRIYLHGADLLGAQFLRVDLQKANLRGANLSAANLGLADLRNADLTGAVLLEADLSGADLTGAIVSEAQLAQAASLKGTILPDGTVHE